jgi:hypothetical protein
MYDIHITYASNGIIAKVGCQTCVFTSIADFMVCLNDYLHNPQDAEDEWMAKAIFKNLNRASVDQDIAPTPPPPMPSLNEVMRDTPLMRSPRVLSAGRDHGNI